jgi:Na+-translocating ferredoxin:NAD+ oxidoreductase RnfE subunit
MKIGISIGTGLFIIGVLLGIIQLWFQPWSFQLFLKLEMTIGALLLIVCVVWFVAKEYLQDKTNRSGDSLDE